MITFFTPLTICVASFIGFAFGFLWYSPIFFTKAWMKGEGVTKETVPKHSLRELVSINVYSLLAHTAITMTLAVVYELLAITSLKIAVAVGLLLTFGFIVTTRFIDMLYTVHGKHYDARSQIKFLVSSGYYLAVVTVITIVLMSLRIV